MHDRDKADGYWPVLSEQEVRYSATVAMLVYSWNNGSPVSREVHAGFCEKLRVRLPRLTHLGRMCISLARIRKNCVLIDAPVK